MSNTHYRIFDKGRLLSLSDGVFAIVMTLLVLQLISDDVTDAVSAADLHKALLELWPKALSYVISFVVAAVFWVNQYEDLHHVKETDNRYLWLNIFFLFWISLLPFSAALLGEHHEYTVSAVLYGCNMIFASLTLHIGWRYAVGGYRLVREDLSPSFIARAHYRLLIGPPVYLLGIGIAFHNPHLSFLIYVLVAILYVLAGIIPDWMRIKALNPLDDPAE